MSEAERWALDARISEARKMVWQDMQVSLDVVKDATGSMETHLQNANNDAERFTFNVEGDIEKAQFNIDRIKQGCAILGALDYLTRGESK